MLFVIVFHRQIELQKLFLTAVLELFYLLNSLGQHAHLLVIFRRQLCFLHLWYRACLALWGLSEQIWGTRIARASLVCDDLGNVLASKHLLLFQSRVPFCFTELVSFILRMRPVLIHCIFVLGWTMGIICKLYFLGQLYLQNLIFHFEFEFW